MRQRPGESEEQAIARYEESREIRAAERDAEEDAMVDAYRRPRALHPLTLQQRESLARELAADPENFRHIVKFDELGWTIQHPLTERNESLFNCKLHTWCRDLDAMPVPEPGRYYAEVDSQGEWEFTLAV